MDNNENGNSVVDLDDLQSGLDQGIPDFLRRNENNEPVGAIADRDKGEVENPVFDTQVNEEGQTELTVEQVPPMSSDDVAMEVLNNLEAQITSGGTTVPQEEVAHSPERMHPEDALQAAADRAQDHALNGDQGTPEIGHNQPADPEEMRREFFKDINKFGKASGEGASALGRLGLRCLRAAADGLISCEKPPKGSKDDSTLIYEAYTAMDSKHSEHTPGGAKANASKLRQIVAMGCMTTLSDPVAIGNRVVRIHEKMTDAELKPKALFAGLVDVARTQQASDTELTDAAIQECLTKTKADKTIEKEWEAIYKRTEALITGEGSHGLKDTSDAAHKICELIGEHVKQYKSDGTRQERIDDMMELGYTKEQAIAIIDKKLGV